MLSTTALGMNIITFAPSQVNQDDKLLGQTINSQTQANRICPPSDANISANGKYITLCVKNTGVNNTKGIYQSTNGGISFTQVFINPRSFNSIDMDMTGNFIYVNDNSGTPNNLYISTDFGTSFTINESGATNSGIKSVSNSSTNISSICCNSTGQYVWATDYNNAGNGYIWLNTNYGNGINAWQIIITITGTPNLSNISYNDVRDLLYFTSEGNGYYYIYKNPTSFSPNLLFGNTKAAATGSGYNNCSGITYSMDGKFVFLTYSTTTGAVNRIWKSTNSGNTFIPVVGGSEQPIGLGISGIQCSYYGKYVYVFSKNTGFNQQDTLYVSSDYGENFSRNNSVDTYSVLITLLSPYGSVRINRTRNNLIIFNAQTSANFSSTGFILSPKP
jgi:hypothetical protein